MYKFFCSILTFLLLEGLCGQTGLIKDPDGYCNVREGANGSTRIIDTLHIDRLVYVLSDQGSSDWIQVDYIKKDRAQADQVSSGYVHRSRVFLLSSLGHFSRSMFDPGILLLRKDSIRIQISMSPFSRQQHNVLFEKDQASSQHVKAIDGMSPWGTDGNIPRKEYSYIKVSSGSSQIALPQRQWKDLFEPNLPTTNGFYDPETKRYYVEALNGDGAGSYVVVWVFGNGGFLYREVFIPF